MFVFDSTIGQQLLRLSYRDPGPAATGGGPAVTGRRPAVNRLSSSKKILYAVLTIGSHWLNDRSTDLKSSTTRFKYHQLMWKIVDVFEKCLKLASLVNFAVFLQQGCYQLLVERIVGLQSVFPRRQYVRQLSYEFMNRELLWHGFSEFLLFVLPFINFHKIKNAVQRVFHSRSTADGLGDKNMDECAICGQSPIGPREIGCNHVFCYYCIQSNVLADSKYSCPVCGHSLSSTDEIKPVQVYIELNDVT
ncbi:peroxisome biogenesis factor 2-like isoform X2 [Tubulanus polymorphus]